MNLEEIANLLSDMDASWYPFLFLRPKQEERLTDSRIAILAALYGVLSGLILDVVLRATHAPIDGRISPLAFPLGLTLAFFVVYRFTFGVAWNVRAARLASDAVSPEQSARIRAWRANFEGDSTEPTED